MILVGFFIISDKNIGSSSGTGKVIDAVFGVNRESIIYCMMLEKGFSSRNSTLKLRFIMKPCQVKVKMMSLSSHCLTTIRGVADDRTKLANGWKENLDLPGFFNYYRY